MSIFGGGPGVPVIATSPTFGAGASAPNGIEPGIAATSSAPTSAPATGSGHAEAPISSAATPPAESFGSAASAAPPASEPDFGVAAHANSSATDSAAPATSAAVQWFAPSILHFDASGPQLSASIIMPADLGVLATSLSVPSSTVAGTAVGSVFSSSDWGNGGHSDGSFSVSELPFMHDSPFDDTPVYTASQDLAWILVADFTGDGWFFV